MTAVKLCGMRTAADIETANRIRPDYIGFVFAPKSRRYISPETAASLKAMLDPAIRAVGVFVDAGKEEIAELAGTGVIDFAQLHGSEDEAYIAGLRTLTDLPLIRAFRVTEKADLEKAEKCSAEHILLDAGAGDGECFDWEILKDFTRPYFLAGGLDADNVTDAVRRFHPYAVDVSSGIETDGVKDPEKMRVFTEAVKQA